MVRNSVIRQKIELIYLQTGKENQGFISSLKNIHAVVSDDDPRSSVELYRVHVPLHPKEIQSQQRIRIKILLGKPQACKNMIRCGLFSSTFWADLKTLQKVASNTSKAKLLICPLRKRFVPCIGALPLMPALSIAQSYEEKGRRYTLLTESQINSQGKRPTFLVFYYKSVPFRSSLMRPLSASYNS
ncbi:hypothetical protein AVEN_253428-1 [Araneus ventricosus]|uniref:Uncharacterized protein n=1 Tax=Araneus ventricosus TaxID=182803 RepID=A0A4Y2HGE8_ARAVE|nr:hypothetical protein AVEN_253428-1 [Araneus ventricosus]